MMLSSGSAGGAACRWARWRRRPAMLSIARCSSAADGGAPEAESTAIVPRPSPSALSKQFAVKMSLEFRGIFPEFLPAPEFDRRNALKEKLERRDMLRRRMHLDVPEFYPGSIVAVTQSDRSTPGRKTRFLGICIGRWGNGLRHRFTLRNFFDGNGIEVMYDMYNPLIQKIDLIRLEKRLDDELYYLRDALPEYSTFPMDMNAVPPQPGLPTPVNETKVKLRLPPWSRRWDLYGFKGIDDAWTQCTPWFKRRFQRARLPPPGFEHDLIADYRQSVPREDQDRIMRDIVEHTKEQMVDERTARRSLFRDAKRFDRTQQSPPSAARYKR